MTNFFKALESVVFNPAPIDVEYRLYYDINGNPLFYSPTDSDGDYIVVSKEDYIVGRYDVTIVDGKIMYPIEYVYQKLTPQDVGTICNSNDVSIISNLRRIQL